MKKGNINMSSLAAKAKQKAKELDAKKSEEERIEKRFSDRLQEQLVVLKAKTMKALRTLNGEKCSKGTINLLTGTKAWYCGDQYLAILELDRGEYVTPANLVLVKAGIQSGTTDMSDDCRNIPYTDAFVSLRNECKRGGDRDQTGLCFLNKYASSEKDLEKILEALSEHLAPLFSSK